MVNNSSTPVAIIGGDLSVTEKSFIHVGGVPATVHEEVVDGVKMDLYSYENLYLGMTDTSGKDVQFPITLQPGQSSESILNMGAILSDETSRLMEKKYSVGAKPKLSEVNEYLRTFNTDIWGRNLRLTSIEQIEQNQPVYHLWFTSSKGNGFNSFFSP